jgi:3-oxoacyl-[acyl-carrier protein] reductase
VGQVTHFVHSASPPRREADHAFAVSRETWQRMHAVNLDAGFHLARELAHALITAHEPGSFLFLTSLHAGTPRNLPHYSTAKAAMAMLVRELARTWGRSGIRVNALVPGAIAAGGFVADPTLSKHIPLGRLGRSEDLAPMALAVLSNRVSAYVTGAAIVVDATGYRMISDGQTHRRAPRPWEPLRRIHPKECCAGSGVMLKNLK